ncbi:hypothetical protein [Brachybacterium sp. J153]|uniref:hypothetical protein n=1 Tax=Brachybacterium sp. J153 TaxID=3116488 RepID=UPI002E783D23|nr:hypothetical protein [Brachybacterium sp. J153]MEE1617729.1 hypothetical protein [Brachybacterium sp. J153]
MGARRTGGSVPGARSGGSADGGAGPLLTRRALARTAVAIAAVPALPTLAACTDTDEAGIVFVADPTPSAVLPAASPAATALSLSALLVESADVVALAPAEAGDALAALTGPARLPLLVGPDGEITEEQLGEELDRLGARTLLIPAGQDAGALGEGRDILEVDLAAEDPSADLPTVTVGAAPERLTLLLDPEQALPAAPVASALVTAAGGTVAQVPGGQLGRSSDSVAAARAAVGNDPTTGVLALGESFGASDGLAGALERAATTPELPGGGQIAFPGRRMVAAYGSPGVPSLGILGEQGLEETIARTQQLAADYQGLTDELVIPAFEIIATIAADTPGGDGDYSRELSVDSLREWVDAAGEAGVYVVLDLQPGTTDFLTQAQRYEELLLEPHVGLALDSEWRLKPGQKHLEQIGSVTGAEVNSVVTWLADLTAEHGLPQKLLILHQFTLRMVTERETIDTSRTELAITLHADGHGAPGDKLATWNALQQGLPEGIFMAWKNFYDEDSPTFTPEETYAVEPRPWFVSYQ